MVHNRDRPLLQARLLIADKRLAMLDQKLQKGNIFKKEKKNIKSREETEKEETF